MGNPPPDIYVYLFIAAAVAVFVFSYIVAEVGTSEPRLPTKFAPPREKKNDWDMVTIGRIVQEQPKRQPKPKVVVKEKVVYRDRPAKKTTPKKQEVDQFYNECVSALVSLGEKKSRARQITASVFHAGRPATMDEFITRAFKQ